MVVAGVNRGLTPDMWTPQSFSRDFGDDYSELVDCIRSVPLPHFPSNVFWDGFEDMSCRLRDPASGEPRLLKQKDWPPGEDFCEKLPKRSVGVLTQLVFYVYGSSLNFYVDNAFRRTILSKYFWKTEHLCS